jgi:hypothetical protein
MDRSAGGFQREGAKAQRPSAAKPQPKNSNRSKLRKRRRKNFARNAQFLQIALQRGFLQSALRTPDSPPDPFPLQNVKEQARGRHADCILPRYYGTANKNRKIFLRAEAFFMPGGGFSGFFFSRRGITPQMPTSAGWP